MSDDDLRYENLDDESYPEEELEAIDLDALDDVIDSESGPEDASTEAILESISTLDDEIEPAAAPLPAPKSIDLDPLDETIDSETAPEPEQVTEGDSAESEIAPELAETVPASRPIDLETLDDVIDSESGPEAEQDEETEEILEAITTLDDEIEPAAEVTAEPAEAVSSPEAATPEVTPEEPSEPEEPAAPPDWIYRVLVAVPAEMSQEMGKLRKLGEITDMPEPGFELVAPFRAENPAQVQTMLKSWARNHLPLQLEVTGVQAEVMGAHDYVAGWTLLPGDDLDEAQADLLRALTSQVTFVPDMPEKPALRVSVGQKVAPGPFPRLVARMQRDFESYVWHAETAVLVRQEADSTTWETVESYR